MLASQLVGPGCAPAVPVLPGALPTPADRGAISAGAAARIPLGSLEEQPAVPGGVAPIVEARYGLSRDTDVGLMAVGALGRADVRHAVRIVDDLTSYAVTFGLAPYVGAVHDGGLRWGAQVPVLFTVDAASVVQLWIGPRFRFERARSDVEGDATGLELGGVLGIGLGFRHFQGLLELSAAYERWWSQIDREGLALTPAFALRLLL